MAFKKQKTECGQGGKLGRSNMSRWESDIKYQSRHRRRLNDKEAVREY